MIPFLLRALDLLAVVTAAGLFVLVARMLLGLLREARFLDDPPAWPESPGARNDRARLLDGGR